MAQRRPRHLVRGPLRGGEGGPHPSGPHEGRIRRLRPLACRRWTAGRPNPPKAGQKIGIFRPNVYDGAALVLYALRQEIGRTSFENLERAWVQEHRDGTATTADFVRLASEISGRDLGGFLQDWLYGEQTPPMPGHPDWKAVAPAAPVK